MAFGMISFLFTERASWERQKEASNRLQTEAVLSFIIILACGHQCQVKYLCGTDTSGFAVFVTARQQAHWWKLHQRFSCAGVTDFLVGAECIAIFLTWTEAVRIHSSGSSSTSNVCVHAGPYEPSFFIWLLPRSGQVPRITAANMKVFWRIICCW